MGGANTRLTILNPGNPTGLKFSVEHGEARCLFDFGLEHAPGRAPFSLGLTPRPGRELEDLQAVGSAPALDGVYARDGWDGRTEVFISHLHLDHTSLVRFLHPEVPLHYPAGMEELRQAAETSGYLPWRSPAGAGVADRQSVRVGEIEVRFVAVDHDLPGASGFLVTTPDLSIAYTGDLRRHGLHPEVTDAFAREVKGVDVLLQEGVMLGYVAPDPAPVERTEAEAIAEIQRLIGEARGLVVVNVYGMNRERVAGVAAGSQAAGRRFSMESRMGALAGWPEVIPDPAEIAAAPSSHCLQLGFESLRSLIDMRPPAGSTWIQSGGPPMGPFDPGWPVLESWLQALRMDLQIVSCSGHSRPRDIEHIVAAVGPRVVVPVHSRAPQALQVPGVPALVPVPLVPYTRENLLAASGSATS